MNSADVKKYCSSYSSVTLESAGPPSNVLTYTVGGKKFAYFKASALYGQIPLGHDRRRTHGSSGLSARADRLVIQQGPRQFTKTAAVGYRG